MNHHIDIRQEILPKTHQWPLILFFIALGALIGLSIALIMPKNYRAETRLSVVYNADAIFRNPDDFKNWEMEQLNLLVLSQPLLQETLNRLQNDDPSWRSITAPELGSMLRVYWRNAGTWRLVATTRDPQKAWQLVHSWREVILDTIDAASQYSNQMTRLNNRLHAANQEQAELKLRQVELNQIKQALENWGNTIDLSLDPPISEQARWYLYSLAARVSQLNPAGQTLLNDFPTSDMVASDYLVWVDSLIILIDNQITVGEQQTLTLDESIGQMNQEWNQAFLASYGLSSYIHVEAVEDVDRTSQRVESFPAFILVGAILGILSWVLVQLALPFVREKK